MLSWAMLAMALYIMLVSQYIVKFFVISLFFHLWHVVFSSSELIVLWDFHFIVHV
jgi:hypothetical protein